MTPPGPGNGSRKAQARQKLEELAPRGSRARAALTSGRAAATEGRKIASQARWRWRWARSPSATTPTYLEWLDAHRPESDQLAEERHRVKVANIAIGVHCVILAGPGEASETIAGLKRQTFPAWQATVVGRRPATAPGAVTSAPDAATALAQAAESGDPDDMVFVLEAGDLLEPDFVFKVAGHAWDNPNLALVHWDDDLADADGLVHDPLFRPSWSPDMLLSANYLGRSFAVRRGRLQAAGGFGERAGDARWWDLLLRLGLEEDEAKRVPRVLTHLRRRPEVSPAEGAELVGARLAAAGEKAEVTVARDAVRVRWELPPKAPSVSIVIPTRSRETLLDTALTSLARTEYPGEVEVVVVDSGARSDVAEQWYANRDDPFALKAVWWEGSFNYSAANNLAAAAAGGDVLVFLNDDIEVVSPDWLAEMVGWATRPGIGLAGLQLLDGSGAIQHGGVAIGMTGFAGHPFAGMRPGEDSIFGSTNWYRDCLSVTAACVAIERSLFERIGGFDERFILCGSDVVLGLDARFLGLRSVVSPFAEVRHLESVTRGEDVPAEDFFTSWWRYQKHLKGGDPYFSPNLALDSPRPALSRPGEPTALDHVGAAIGRSFAVFRQSSTAKESEMLVNSCRADAAVEAAVRAQHAAEPGPIEDPGRALDDQRQVLGAVVLEPVADAEAVAQRRGQQPRAGGRADQREGGERQGDGAGARALAEDHRQLAVLHRRVERLLDRAAEAVDLVDEEDAAGLQRGEEGGDVGLALERRARGLDQRHAELGGDDVGERGLPQPGRAGEEDVVERLAAAAGGLDEDPQLLGDLDLVDEVGERRRPQRAVEVLDVGAGVVHLHLGVDRHRLGVEAGRADPVGAEALGRVEVAHRLAPALRRAPARSSSASSPSRPSSSCSASSGW